MTFDGYQHAEGFLDGQTIQAMSKYYENKLRRGEIISQTDQDIDNCNVTKIGYYADPFGEVMLEFLLPKVEEITGLELCPTYSYFRIYQPGERLPPHVDRPSCEISVTLNIAQVGPENKIWMQHGSSEASSYSLSPGDAVVYKGCDVTHWRPFVEEGTLIVQLMLHYVDKNGPNAMYNLDKRKQIGDSSCR
jgi:hypothetical protein